MSFAPFAGQKYLNLETFKKNGTGVKTPVWFAADPSASLDSNGAKLYVYTIGVSGKVKRIRNNPHVKIAPCDMRGRTNIFLGNSCWISSPSSGGAITPYSCSVPRERCFTWARASQMCRQSANCRPGHQTLL